MAFKIFCKNCCGLDIHKTWIYACIGITDANGRTEYKQARFSSFSNGLRELAGWLTKHSCADVCMESTGKYWIPVFNILEKTCWVTLAHPKYTKPQKGNKTDRKDAKWICDLYMCGMGQQGVRLHHQRAELESLCQHRGLAQPPPLQDGKYPYVYMDGIYLKRNWGGAYENVSVLVAIAVNEDGYREAFGAAEGMKEDKASWVSFFQWLRRRGLEAVKLIVGDKCLGMLEAVGEVFPEAKYQHCVVHFYRNVFSVVPKSKVKNVAKMLKAIHAQESKKASREKAASVVAVLKAMKLPEAAKKVADGIEETLTYCDFPSEHWTKIRTNNVIERMNREIRLRTRVVGAFPDGNSALMLVCARLRHVAGTQWGQQEIHEHEAPGCLGGRASGRVIAASGRKESRARRAAYRRP